VSSPTAVTIDVGGAIVSGLLQTPPDARACVVLAHGAGAGMRHPFMGAIADGLEARGLACLRYQFLYMERASKRPDAPKLAHAAVRAAVLAAHEATGLPLIAGGKSFGGRMTSQAQAEAALPGVVGLAFLGFPLHPPGRSSIERADHLAGVAVPMLFLQGTRDEFADLTLLAGVVDRLGSGATLKLFEDADHSFHVPKASGRTNRDVREALLDTLAAWIGAGGVKI